MILKDNSKDKSNMSDTQLTNISSGYNTERMVFSEAISGSIPETTVSFKRILISSQNEDGSIGDLIIETEKDLFSFGVSENIDPKSKEVTGWTHPICLCDKNNPTQAQKDWITNFTAIVDRAKEYLVENKDEIEQYDLVMSDLKKFNPLYYKKDKGKIVKGSTPTLYPKLMYSRKNDRIISVFFDPDNADVNPFDLIGKYCTSSSSIKIESIFIGSKISLQVKVYEAEITLVQMGMKRLMRRPKADDDVTIAKDVSSNPMQSRRTPASKANDASDAEEKNEGEKSQDEGSIKGSDDEEEKEPEIKKVRRRVKKRVARKPVE
jgi:hypothetical protein